MSILVPSLISSTIQKRTNKINLIRYILDIFTGIIWPIKLQYELVATRLIKKKLSLMDNVKMAPNFKEVVLRIRFLEAQMIRHSRIQLGLETIFQLTGNAILLLFAYSKTRSRQGLSSLFESDTDIFSGLSLPAELLIALLLLMNLLSFVKVQINGIVEGFASNYSFRGKAMILLGIICAALVRIGSMTLYFSTNLGLFDLLHHYQGKNIKKINNSLQIILDDSIFIAEMLEFQGLRPYSPNATNLILHIHPLTNISLSLLQRGKLNTIVTDVPSGPLFDFIYQPPPLELYTKFSLQTYFFVFWGIFILQTITILIIDKIWIKNVPKSAKLWDRTLHAMQKSSFPFPYTNWHQEKGSCYEHLKRKQAVQQEVLVAILINMLFNMILLIPLPIFCKI